MVGIQRFRAARRRNPRRGFARGHLVVVDAERLDLEHECVFDGERHDGEQRRGVNGGRGRTIGEGLLPDPDLSDAA